MAAGLLQPFIDLGPCTAGPIFSQSVAHYWDAFRHPEKPRFALQRTLPRRFRAQALSEIGYAPYVAEDPRDIAPELRTEKWQQLCAALDHWSELSQIGQSRLVLLLHALCFYELIPRLLSPMADHTDLSDPIAAELAYLRASAVYVLGLPNRVADYADADLGDFIRIATAQDVPPQVGFDAAIKLLTHLAKNGGTVEELTRWCDCAAGHLARLRREGSAFDADLCESRFRRAAAFIPQRLGDRDEVVAIMDAAERCADALQPANDAQVLLRGENLHPLLESRTKEAIWLGDHDLALDRAQKVTQIDPFEARGWLELGQVFLRRQQFEKAANAYLTAAMIGPPATAIAHHMAGICFLELGQPAVAAFMLKTAVDLDPGAISSRNHIRQLPQEVVFEELKRWSLRTAQL